MINDVKEYHNGIKYEIFIKRAFKYYPGHPRIGYWRNDFGKVYKKVESAIDRFLKRRINKVEREGLMTLKVKLRSCYSKESLIQIIEEAIEVTQRHKEYKIKR
jgi:hypothetical protein